MERGVAKLELENLEHVLRVHRTKAKKDAMNIAEGLRKAAHIILKKSQELVPVDTERLKKSGRVEVKGTGLNTEARVVYDAPYAVYVHERLDQAHEPPTQAKFVTEAIRRTRGTVTAMLRRQFTVGRDSKYGYR